MIDPPLGPGPRRRGWMKFVLVLVTFPLAFYLGALFEFHQGVNLDGVLAPVYFAQPVKKFDTSTLQEIWEKVQLHYVRTNLEPQKALDGASKGLVKAIGDAYGDGNSYFETPGELANRRQFLAGSFGGIGATMAPDTPEPTVAAVMPDSPAQKAGIKAGDVIIAINGVDSTAMKVQEVVDRIRGKSGTHVKVTIRRGASNIDFDLVRAEIPVPSVRSKDVVPGVLYIRTYEFGAHTGDEFHKALAEGLARGDKRIVLDLRGNPGGYVTDADAVTSEFVKDGLNVVLVYRDGKREEHPVNGKPIASDQKLVVLVDGNSASASEIVAGALRDHKRALLVGEKTYGKGSVQDDFPVRNGGNLHLTIAYYYTPSGQLLEHNPLVPDKVVPLPSPDAFYQVDLASSDPHKDPQLEAALQLLR